MIGKLRAHEDRHLAIAMEEADRLAKELVGKEIGRIPAMVTAANARMNTRQKELDRLRKSGSKPACSTVTSVWISRSNEIWAIPSTPRSLDREARGEGVQEVNPWRPVTSLDAWR